MKAEEKKEELAKKIAKGHPHRSSPIGREVGELRKLRGSETAEKELHSYKKAKEYYKASGTSSAHFNK